MEDKPNNINQVHTNKVITWKAVIQQSADEAAEATTKATKRNATPTTILPMIMEQEDARKEAKCQNITNQSIVGTKEGVIKSLIRIVGGGVLDAITMSPDGSDYRSIDDYTLHELMQVAIDHASRPEVDDVRDMLMTWYDTEFDFRKSIHLNMQALKEAATSSPNSESQSTNRNLHSSYLPSYSVRRNTSGDANSRQQCPTSKSCTNTITCRTKNH